MSNVARMALNYFVFFGALGAFWPYLGPHLRGLGLSGAQIGALTAIQPIAVFLLAPVIGAFADRRGQHRRVFQALAVTGACLAIALSQANSFAPVLFLLIAWSASVAALMPIMDSYAITIADSAGVAFGRLRLWGTLGYMITVTIVGWVSQSLPRGAFLIVYAVGLLCAVAAASLLAPSQTFARAAGPALRIDVGAIAKQPALLAMLIVSFCTAIGMSTLGNFFSIFLTTELGASTALLGTVNAVLALSEIPVMLGAGWLQRKLGNRVLVAIALCGYIVRFFCMLLCHRQIGLCPFRCFMR